ADSEFDPNAWDAPPIDLQNEPAAEAFNADDASYQPDDDTPEAEEITPSFAPEAAADDEPSFEWSNAEPAAAVEEPEAVDTPDDDWLSAFSPENVADMEREDAPPSQSQLAGLLRRGQQPEESEALEEAFAIEDVEFPDPEPDAAVEDVNQPVSYFDDSSDDEAEPAEWEQVVQNPQL